MSNSATKKATVQDAVRGGWLEFGTLSLDPASIPAASQGTAVVTVAGAKSGDLVFVNPRQLDNKLANAGAKVTADNTITVYINNVIDATTAVDGASLTWDYILIHMS